MNARPAVDMESYCSAIGLVAMQWSGLENSVHRLLWRFASLETNIGRCVTQHVGLGTIWDSILALSVELKLPAERQVILQQLFARCEPLRLKRNEVVHAQWGITSGTNLVKGELTAIVVKARKRLKVEFHNHNVEFMHTLAEDISALSLEIANQAVLPLSDAGA
ncbi:hypothetical protein [Piscinibacter gummiphilus]|uniref:Uncharacterized protein n=1 Tax=Piscinibacter gummiphilus TaxID=946333 RepID=A0ABZ0CV81_9BURK|nr:hypothetical protein [Piscinibacter gummiphilus]WOB06852.1 hypothetical protein RXV79_18240 [Piscinibacter gummiphilus]